MIKDTTKRQINVLVVDDDVDICLYLTELLTRHGYAVSHTTDPESVLPKLREEMFQIILLDIVMPQLDGVELLRRIRRIDEDVCVIILSGYPSFESARDAFKGACYDYLTKPCDNERLLQTLDHAIHDCGLISDLNHKATMHLAKVVQALRKEQNLSLRQLANRTGLSTSLIYQIEHAHTSPSLATISRLSTALKTPLEQFFKGL